MRDIKNFLCSFQVTYLRVHLSENSSSLKWGTFLLVRDRFIKSLFFLGYSFAKKKKKKKRRKVKKEKKKEEEARNESFCVSNN